MKLVFDNNFDGKKVIKNIGQVLFILITIILLIFCLIKWGDQMQILVVNFMVALLGVLLAIEAMIYGYKRLDKLTKFNTSDQLERGNQAVGLVIGGLFVGIGIVVGLVMALGVN